MPLFQIGALTPLQCKEAKHSKNKTNKNFHEHVKEVSAEERGWQVVSDQASACAGREDRDWKHQQKNVAGELVCQADRSGC